MVTLKARQLIPFLKWYSLYRQIGKIAAFFSLQLLHKRAPILQKKVGIPMYPITFAKYNSLNESQPVIRVFAWANVEK